MVSLMAGVMITYPNNKPCGTRELKGVINKEKITSIQWTPPPREKSGLQKSQGGNKKDKNKVEE